MMEEDRQARDVCHSCQDEMQCRHRVTMYTAEALLANPTRQTGLLAAGQLQINTAERHRQHPHLPVCVDVHTEFVEIIYKESVSTGLTSQK